VQPQPEALLAGRRVDQAAAQPAEHVPGKHRLEELLANCPRLREMVVALLHSTQAFAQHRRAFCQREARLSLPPARIDGLHPVACVRPLPRPCDA